jgi:CRP-like cAMP-binding protein
VRTIADELREHEFTRGMAPEHLTLIAGCGRNVVLTPGSWAFREGDPADTFWLLRAGRVALEVHSPTAGGLVVETLGEGEVLGWSWLFPPHRYAFDARVVEPTRAIAFDGACLRGKAERDPVLGYELMKRVARVFTQRLTATRLQLLDMYGDVRAAHRAGS